eukprot:2002725-Rhodomonas_salina.2
MSGTDTAGLEYFMVSINASSGSSETLNIPVQDCTALGCEIIADVTDQDTVTVGVAAFNRAGSQGPRFTVVQVLAQPGPPQELAVVQRLTGGSQLTSLVSLGWSRPDDRGDGRLSDSTDRVKIADNFVQVACDDAGGGLSVLNISELGDVTSVQLSAVWTTNYSATVTGPDPDSNSITCFKGQAMTFQVRASNVGFEGAWSVAFQGRLQGLPSPV